MTDNTEIMTDITELWNRIEELDPELVECLDETETLGLCFKHPLLYAVPYCQQLNAFYNQSFRHKLEYRDKAREEKRWASFLFIHEKPYRFNAFRQIQDHLTDAEYWELLSDLWTGSENLWQVPFLGELLSSNRPKREMMMSEKERKFFRELPNTITVHRGHQHVNRNGWSWTLDLEKAKWFAVRWRKDGEVLTGTLPKAKAIAYLGGRTESEIIARPSHVKFLDNRRARDL